MAIPHALGALLLSLLFIPTSIASNADSKLASVRTLYQFSHGSWIENIAVRPNGNLLFGRLDVPEIYQLDPFDADCLPKPVVSVPGVTSIFGIAETAPDVFAFANGNYTLQNGSVASSWSVRQVRFNHRHGAEVSKIADAPDVGLLNGMTVLPASEVPHEVLASDTGTGVIYRVSPSTGAFKVVINDTLTAVAGNVLGATGVNGIRISPSRPDVLYLANTGKSILASISVNPLTGEPRTEGQVIANITAIPGIFNFDDFALPHNLEKDNAAYIVTSAGNSIERISLETGHRQLVAGNLNSTLIAGPTSAAFGRGKNDREVLYVVTGGAQLAPVNGTVSVGAQVLAVDVGRWRNQVRALQDTSYEEN